MLKVHMVPPQMQQFSLPHSGYTCQQGDISQPVFTDTLQKQHKIIPPKVCGLLLWHSRWRQSSKRVYWKPSPSNGCVKAGPKTTQFDVDRCRRNLFCSFDLAFVPVIRRELVEMHITYKLHKIRKCCYIDVVCPGAEVGSDVLKKFLQERTDRQSLLTKL